MMKLLVLKKQCIIPQLLLVLILITLLLIARTRNYIGKGILEYSLGLTNQNDYVKSCLANLRTVTLPNVDFNTNTFFIIKPNLTPLRPNFPLPITISHKYERSEAVTIAADFIQDYAADLMEMLRENDIRQVIETLKTKCGDLNLTQDEIDENNLLFWIKLMKLKELEKVTKSEMYKPEDKINVLQTQIKELKERYDNVIKGECNICLDNIGNPTFLACCQHVICNKCAKAVHFVDIL